MKRSKINNIDIGMYNSEIGGSVFVVDDSNFAGKFSGDPKFSIQVAQPQNSQCRNEKGFGSSNTLCLIWIDFKSAIKSGNDRIEYYELKYKFNIVYRGYSSNIAEEIIGSSIKNYRIKYSINYKDMPVQFKSMTVTEFYRCSNGGWCSNLAISPIQGGVFTMQNDYHDFESTILSLPVNTDAVQIVELVIDSERPLRDYYAEIENPIIGQDPVDDIRQKGGIDTLLDIFGLSLKQGLLLLLIVGAIFL